MADAWGQWCAAFDRTMQAGYEAHHHRWMWRTINAVIDQSGIKKQPALINYLNSTYVAYIASFVRREIDVRKGVLSLTRCIKTLEANPSLMTRSQYLAASALAHEDLGPDPAAGFRVFAPNDGETMDRKVLVDRRMRLASAASGVKAFVDENLAHTALNPTGVIPTFGEVDSAMQEIETIEKELFLLRNPGTALWTVEPVGDLAFLEMFRVAWLPPGTTLPARPS